MSKPFLPKWNKENQRKRNKLMAFATKKTLYLSTSCRSFFQVLSTQLDIANLHFGTTAADQLAGFIGVLKLQENLVLFPTKSHGVGLSWRNIFFWYLRQNETTLRILTFFFWMSNRSNVKAYYTLSYLKSFFTMPQRPTIASPGRWVLSVHRSDDPAMLRVLQQQLRVVGRETIGLRQPGMYLKNGKKNTNISETICKNEKCLSLRGLFCCSDLWICLDVCGLMFLLASPDTRTLRPPTQTNCCGDLAPKNTLPLPIR